MKTFSNFYEIRTLSEEGVRQSFQQGYQKAKGSWSPTSVQDAAASFNAKANKLASWFSHTTGVPAPLAIAIITAGASATPVALATAVVAYFTRNVALRPILNVASKAYDKVADGAEKGWADYHKEHPKRGAFSFEWQVQNDLANYMLYRELYDEGNILVSYHEWLQNPDFELLSEAEKKGVLSRLAGMAGAAAGHVAGFGGSIGDALDKATNWIKQHPRDAIKIIYMAAVGSMLGAAAGKLSAAAVNKAWDMTQGIGDKIGISNPELMKPAQDLNRQLTTNAEEMAGEGDFGDASGGDFGDTSAAAASTAAAAKPASGFASGKVQNDIDDSWALSKAKSNLAAQLDSDSVSSSATVATAAAPAAAAAKAIPNVSVTSSDAGDFVKHGSGFPYGPGEVENNPMEFARRQMNQLGPTVTQPGGVSRLNIPGGRGKSVISGYIDHSKYNGNTFLEFIKRREIVLSEKMHSEKPMLMKKKKKG